MVDLVQGFRALYKDFNFKMPVQKMNGVTTKSTCSTAGQLNNKNYKINK